MVFIKDVVAMEREREILSHRQTIEKQLKTLQEISNNEEDLYRLRTICSTLKTLCSGKKRLSDSAKARDREYQKKRYSEKKEEILQKNKDKRREMRRLKDIATTT
jgi:hypothetical protein